ncbi:hypothetical protein B0T25DRAFT_636134, partial [Lasiosphaeria hispida]
MLPVISELRGFSLCDEPRKNEQHGRGSGKSSGWIWLQGRQSCGHGPLQQRPWSTLSHIMLHLRCRIHGNALDGVGRASVVRDRPQRCTPAQHGQLLRIRSKSAVGPAIHLWFDGQLPWFHNWPGTHLHRLHAFGICTLEVHVLHGRHPMSRQLDHCDRRAELVLFLQHNRVLPNELRCYFHQRQCWLRLLRKHDTESPAKRRSRRRRGYRNAASSHRAQHSGLGLLMDKSQCHHYHRMADSHCGGPLSPRRQLSRRRPGCHPDVHRRIIIVVVVVVTV